MRGKNPIARCGAMMNLREHLTSRDDMERPTRNDRECSHLRQAAEQDGDYGSPPLGIVVVPPMGTVTGMAMETGEQSRKRSNTLSCKRKEEQQVQPDHPPAPKKPRLVFTDLQRRTLQAIFKVSPHDSPHSRPVSRNPNDPFMPQETKRPSKEMQVTIARQLGLEPQTVGNFFMNARRRSQDKWKDDDTVSCGGKTSGGSTPSSEENLSPNPHAAPPPPHHGHILAVPPHSMAHLGSQHPDNL
ncbi:unnamed protein product [Darwinula stevensoni]|uniref:Homeobox domain-containing protein n=1 Tax=Darwinula stevensoni TaxID=69355 RepID=A0A7R9FPC5_9CRUS|nr:unnamed protein product [Darwinula stevensoni]CAG0897785.1 unnamed protein product [Darwinula stevensoni]